MPKIQTVFNNLLYIMVFISCCCFLTILLYFWDFCSIDTLWHILMSAHSDVCTFGCLLSVFCCVVLYICSNIPISGCIYYLRHFHYLLVCYYILWEYIFYLCFEWNNEIKIKINILLNTINGYFTKTITVENIPNYNKNIIETSTYKSENFDKIINKNLRKITGKIFVLKDFNYKILIKILLLTKLQTKLCKPILTNLCEILMMLMFLLKTINDKILTKKCLTEKCLTEKCLVKNLLTLFLTKFFKLNLTKWCRTICSEKG